MTEHRQPRNVNWFWPIWGLCGVFLLLAWAGRSYTSSASATNEIIDDGESQVENDAILSEPGKSTAITDTEPTPTTIVSGGKPAEVEKPPLGQITVLVPTKKFKKEGKNKAFRIGFDDIDVEKVLNTKQLSADLPKAMPEWLRDLNGQRIRMRGYMHPGSAFQAEGIKRFIFCRDTSACCFGPDPTIFYLIMTTMKSGTSINYIERESFDIEGIFRIDPIIAEKTGTVAEFYHIDDAQMVRR